MGMFSNGHAAKVGDDIERDIQALIAPVQYAPPEVRAATQADAGRLSAEVMTQEYTTAAAGVEAMGEALKAIVNDCENMVRSAMRVIEELGQTAEHYRAEGERVATMIKRCSALTADVRQTCTDLQAKIDAPA